MSKQLSYEEAHRLFEYEPAIGLFTRRVSVRGSKVKVGNVVGFNDGKGYLLVGVDGKHYQLHRVIWLLMTGVWPVTQIDHISGVRSDNRWSNLRVVSHQENGWNQGKPSNNTSGYKGIHFHKARRKWQARICVYGQRYHLGLFITPEEANACYNGAAALAFGDFMRKEQP